MLTIAWDVDDVLNDLMRYWLESRRAGRAGSAPVYEDLTENPPHTLLGIEKEHYLRSLDEFRLSSAFQAMPPDPEICAWLAQHGHRFHHLALTATPRKAASASAAWVFRHFGDWIRTFHFVPSLRPGEELPAYDLTKADYLRRWAGVDVFIDDSEMNLNGAKDLGIRCFLVSRPWNSGGMTVAEILGALSTLE